MYSLICKHPPLHAVFVQKGTKEIYRLMSDDEFREAASLFASQDYQRAIELYQHIISRPGIAPEVEARALSNISACYASLKNFGKALESALKSVKLQPGIAKTLARVATAYEGMKHYEESVKYFKKAKELEFPKATYAAPLERVEKLLAISRNPPRTENKPSYYYTKSLERAKEAMQTGNYIEAIRHYSKALDLLPSSNAPRETATLLANRSAALARAARMEESADDALHATQIDPHYARGFFRLGFARKELKRYSDAYEALKASLCLDPDLSAAKQLIEEIQPYVVKEQQQAEERAASEARHIEEINQRRNEERFKKESIIPLVHHAHAISYVCCSYCNESGHNRAECPLRRRKRRRME